MRFVPSAAIGLVFMACGGSKEAPLGGPYGGTASPPGPDPGNFQGSGTDGGVGSTLDGGGSADGAPNVGSDGGGGDGVATVTSDGGNGGTKGGGVPTWEGIYDTYLSKTSPGMCSTCHVEMSTGGSAYSWLTTQGFIDGAYSPLVSPAQSCLSWYGGDMPLGGPSYYPEAVAAMDAWAAAGALETGVSDN